MPQNKSNCVQVSLPATGGNTSTSAALDFDSFRPGARPAFVRIIGEIEIGPLVALPGGETITVKAQDSADGTNFADLAGVTTGTITGPKQGRSKTDNLALPSSTQRFLRLVAVSSASAGDLSAVSATLTLNGVQALD